MDEAEYASGDPAPATGVYGELNIFGTPTQRTAHVLRGEPLPDSFTGYSWRLEQPGCRRALD